MLTQSPKRWLWVRRTWHGPTFLMSEKQLYINRPLQGHPLWQISTRKRRLRPFVVDGRRLKTVWRNWVLRGSAKTQREAEKGLKPFYRWAGEFSGNNVISKANDSRLKLKKKKKKGRRERRELAYLLLEFGYILVMHRYIHTLIAYIGVHSVSLARCEFTGVFIDIYSMGDILSIFDPLRWTTVFWSLYEKAFSTIHRTCIETR